MGIVLELAPKLETELRHEAAKAGFDTNGYIVNTLKKHLGRRRPKHTLNHNESELLKNISLGLSQDSWQRYNQLQAKRRAETLTPHEQTELIALSDQIEIANARRMQSLVKLAQLRQTPLEQLMKNLGMAIK